MKKISAEEFDRRFDAGEDMSAFINWDSAKPLSRSPAATIRKPEPSDIALKPKSVSEVKKANRKSA
jgi:hypothetical protein